ncbi:MAG: helix-turn-helix transcriptional regulator [Alphaproteobacteria bacterium]|nr:helix-turn-helix transcriptional regulator [Alphaproteobacteria bacterium]
MITAAQLRAARGLLDWSRSDLSKASGISPETIKNIEHGTFRPQETTEEAIIRAFAVHGVEFTENDGIRRNQNKVFTYSGIEGFKSFLDDVYQAALRQSTGTNGDKPIFVSNVDDRFFVKHLYDYSVLHAKRMEALQNKIRVKILAKDGVSLEIPDTNYREYRLQTDATEGNVPFYVYGDKLGILIFEENKEPQIVVISSALVAKAYRDMFHVLWRNAKPIKATETA